MEFTLNKGNIEGSYEKYSHKIQKYEERNLFIHNNDNNNIANDIHKNCNDIEDNSDFIDTYYEKIVSKEKKIRELLTFDLLYYEPNENEKVSDLVSLKNKTIEELAKYQGIVGGYNLEDLVWNDCNDRFTLKDNQIGIFNTCAKNFIYDKDQIWFIKSLIKHIKKYVKNDKLIADYKMFEDEHNSICWIILVFEERNLE